MPVKRSVLAFVIEHSLALSIARGVARLLKVGCFTASRA